MQRLATVTHEKKMNIKHRSNTLINLLVVAILLVTSAVCSQAQPQTITGTSRNSGRPVVIPITYTMKEGRTDTELQNIDLTVSEDGEPQVITSIRGVGTNSPITLAVLIQEDLVPSVANEIKPLGEFIRNLPKGSRVMVGYLRAGSLQVRQKFTTDLERAAKSLRIPAGLASVGPYNPYVEVIEALRRFDSQPLGRRAILLVSDGLDISRGIDSSLPTQSIDLQRAILESQRKSVAIYGFYAPTVVA
jgi:hypothetical protein